MASSASLLRQRARARKRFLTYVMYVTEEIERSVVYGSELTGAAGQPVDTGNLRNSWIGRWIANTLWILSTNVAYARIVEDNTRGVTFKNHGPHSVKDTVLRIRQIKLFALLKARRAA